MKNIAGIFAGQGAQAPGMGKDLFEAHTECADLFTRADDILGFNLSKICFEGPAEELTKTNICQPAIFVMSAACLTALRKLRTDLEFCCVAGLSLGEWTALWAAGAISFEDAVKILEARGRFMQESCEAAPSGMVSILRAGTDVAAEIAKASGCTVANYNAAEQTVLSGSKEQVAEAEKIAAEKGARAMVLQVAGGYHSKFMEPAAEKFASVIADAVIHQPSVPVLSNFTGQPHGSSEEIKHAMLAQITGSVRWTDNLSWMSGHSATTFVEFGPGRVLTGLVKRAIPEATLFNVATDEQVRSVAQ
jgi:[acyl-carrier-protein] S-malonyltransferase